MRAIGSRYIVEPVKEEARKDGLVLTLNPNIVNLGKPVHLPINSMAKKSDLLIYKKTGAHHFIEDDKEYITMEFQDVVAFYRDGVKKIENMVIPSNYVLVEITHDPTKIDLAGNEIFIDTSYKKEFHAPTYGVVSKLPEEMICLARAIQHETDHEKRKRMTAVSMPWDTNCEVEIGDIVHFDYLQESVCKRDGLIFDEDEKKYFLIHYSQMYAAERGDEIRMLNGFMAVDIQSEEKVSEISSLGIVTINMKESDKRKTWGEGTVVYAGSPNTMYILWDVDESQTGVKAGDRIVFKETKRSKFGQDMHIRCKQLKGLYRVQRKDVHYVQS